MQVMAKANVKFGDRFLTAGEVVDVSENPNEELFDEVKTVPVEEVKEVKPKKKKLAK